MAGRNRISKLEILDLIYFLQAHPEGVSFSDLMEVFKKDFRSVQRWIDDVREYFPDALIMTRRGRFKYFSLVPVLKKSLLVDFSREDLEVLDRVYEQVSANGNSRDANRLRNCISRIRTYCTQLKLAGLAHDTEVFKDLARDKNAVAVKKHAGPEVKTDDDVITAIEEAVRGNRVLETDYRRTSDEGLEQGLRLEPIGVIYNDQRAYLVARKHYPDGVSKPEGQEDAPHYYRIDRMTKTSMTDDFFIANPQDKGVENYTKNDFGIFHEEPFEVEWKFDQFAAKRAKEYHFHAGQKLREKNDGTLTVSFKAGGWAEMYWFLQKWGSHVQVIKPEDWAERTAGIDSVLP